MNGSTEVIRTHVMKNVMKYMLASSFIAILSISAFALCALNQYHAHEVRDMHEKLEMCLKTFWQLLAHKGTDFRIVDGKLLAGNYPVNGNFELPDKVQEIFGGVATIFMGDERVSTNVLNAEGKRAVGTRLVGPAYDAVFREGKPYRGEAAILGVPYLTAYDPIRDGMGKIIGVLFVGVKMSDSLAPLYLLKMQLTLTLFCMVTVFSAVIVLLGRAMKRAEDANENQFRFQETLLNTIPSPIFFKDAGCRYLGCNKAFEAYVGISREELIGKTPHELWQKELADRYRQQDLSLLENPGLQVYESSVRYADDTLRDVIFNKATFSNSDGSTEGLVGVIIDITERKRAEETTKNAYQQLFDIVEFLPDATFVVDKDKRVIAWNRAIEQMTGIEKRDIVGKGDYAYAIPFYGEHRPLLIDLLDQEEERLRRNYKDIRQEGHTLFAEVFVSTFHNGESRCFWATATPLFDQEGNPAGGIESIRDITSYKQAEERRTLLESQLHHARMMETLMIRLGHDLRTPLTPLFALFPLISERIAGPALRRMVDICCKSAASVKKLVDRAQMLVRLSATIRTEELMCIPLVSAVERALADSSDSMAQNHVACRNEVAPSIVVRAVPDQLKELFANLISNAVRFSPKNGVIRITAEQLEETVTVAVHDDGIGLDPDHLESIFDEFFKADESRHDLDAPGLGLSICKRIVLNHNGRIWAESPGIGQGTTIKFTINEKGADRRYDM